MVLSLKEALESGKLIPQKNIREGKITENSFVVSFFSILDGKADPMYQDPQQFFKLTHMTHNLEWIFKESLVRVSTGEAKPLMVVDTTFGGGKTHTLVGLYHLYKNSAEAAENEKIREIINDLGLNSVPEVSLVSIDCRDLTGIGSDVKTIWGEIGKQLDSYDLMEDYDNQLQRPTTEVLTEMIENSDKPVLILMDELVNYLKDSEGIKVGDTNLSEITISFLHNITEVIAKTEKAMMFVTLPGDEPSYKKEAELLEEFKESVRSIIAREGAFVVPLKKEDVYKIVKNRLFEHVDSNLATQVSEEMLKFYSKNFTHLPEVIQSNDYIEKLKNAYPFHPVIVDILYDRIATINQFNKTRGVLRLLSHVIKEVYHKRENIGPDLIITPGIIDLLDTSIYQELTNRIDRGNFQSVIRTDIINDENNAHAQSMDGLLYLGPNVRIASTIYLYTLIGSTKEYSKGANIKDIALAVSMPKFLYPGDVEDSIEKMDGLDGLWYMKQTTGKYYFTVEPNLKRLIHAAKSNISKREIKSNIKARLGRLLKKSDIFDVRLWESDVRNPTKATLVVPDYHDYSSTEGGKASEALKDIVKKEGHSYRDKINLIYLLVAKKERIYKMEDTVALHLAIKEIKTSPDSKEEVKSYKKKLEEYEKEKDSESNSAIELCYSMIFYPKGTDLKYVPLQNGFEGAKNLPEKVYKALMKVDKIIDKLHPDFIADRVLMDKPIPFSELYGRFQKNPSYPFPIKKDVVIRAVNKGVSEGIFAVYEGSIQILDELDIENFEEIAKNFDYKKDIRGGVKDAYYIIPQEQAEEISEKLNQIVRNSKNCPHCNKRNPKEATECIRCGKPFKIVKICPYPDCQAENDPNAKECIKCGAPFETKNTKLCPFCNLEIPQNSQKCPECGKDLIRKKVTITSYNDLDDLEEATIEQVQFDVSNSQTLRAISFRLTTFTTTYRPLIEASVKGNNISFTLKDTKNIDVNELADIIQKLSNLVQEDVSSTVKIKYENEVELSSLIDTFKALETYEDDLKFRAQIWSGPKELPV